MREGHFDALHELERMFLEDPTLDAFARTIPAISHVLMGPIPDLAAYNLATVFDNSAFRHALVACKLFALCLQQTGARQCHSRPRMIESIQNVGSQTIPWACVFLMLPDAIEEQHASLLDHMSTLLLSINDVVNDKNILYNNNHLPPKTIFLVWMRLSILGRDFMERIHMQSPPHTGPILQRYDRIGRFDRLLSLAVDNEQDIFLPLLGEFAADSAALLMRNFVSSPTLATGASETLLTILLSFPLLRPHLMAHDMVLHICSSLRKAARLDVGYEVDSKELSRFHLLVVDSLAPIVPLLAQGPHSVRVALEARLLVSLPRVSEVIRDLRPMWANGSPEAVTLFRNTADKISKTLLEILHRLQSLTVFQSCGRAFRRSIRYIETSGIEMEGDFGAAYAELCICAKLNPTPPSKGITICASPAVGRLLFCSIVRVTEAGYSVQGTVTSKHASIADVYWMWHRGVLFQELSTASLESRRPSNTLCSSSSSSYLYARICSVYSAIPN